MLLGRYARAMVEEALGRPLLVFFDDAHLLDNGSAILVHQMALTQAATVLATVRAGEVLPDPVLSLWKDGPAERIEIGILDDATIEELLAHLQRRFDQAEQELGALATQATSDAEKARVASLRFDNVYIEGGADFQIVDDALADITDPFWRDELVNGRLYATAVFSPPRETVKAAATWLQSSETEAHQAVLHPLVRMGRLDEALEQLTPSPGYHSGPCARRAVAPLDRTCQPSRQNEPRQTKDDLLRSPFCR